MVSAASSPILTSFPQGLRKHEEFEERDDIICKRKKNRTKHRQRPQCAPGPAVRSVGFYSIYFSLDIATTDHLRVKHGLNAVFAAGVTRFKSSLSPVTSQGVNLDKGLYGVLLVACYRQDIKALRC